MLEGLGLLLFQLAKFFLLSLLLILFFDDDFLLGDGFFVSGVSAEACSSTVEFCQGLVATVENHGVFFGDFGFAGGCAYVGAVGSLNAQDEDAFSGEVELSEGFVRHPVFGLDLGFSYGVSAGQVEQAGVVADIEGGPASQGQADQAGEPAIDPCTSEDDPEDENSKGDAEQAEEDILFVHER